MKSLKSSLAKGCVRIGHEAAANFSVWFERNFVNPRAGRIGGESYSRAGALDDHADRGLWYKEALDRAWADYRQPLDPSELAYIVSHPLIALQLSVGITDLRGLRCMRRGLTLRTNSLQQKAYRSRYYERDNARRRMLAAERRKIRRRTTTNPCPSPDEFRAAFADVARSVEAKILFGGMVHDLACHVDSCLRIDAEGNIVGRNGGIKAWIADNVPELSPRYKTIMRYKALAMRVRQATGAKDPEPTSALFGETSRTDAKRGAECGFQDDRHAARGGGQATASAMEEAAEGGRTRRQPDENYYASDSHGRRDATSHGRRDAVPGQARTRMRKLERLLEGYPNTFKDVFDRADAALDGP